jgi:hypothetical protein
MGNYRGRVDEESDSDNESVETSRADQPTPTPGHQSDSEDSQKGNFYHESDDEDEVEIDDDDNEDDTLTEMAESAPTPRVLQPPPQPWANARSQSAASLSTVASFATAIEGNEGPYSEDEEDEAPHEILNWGGNVQAFPTPPMTSPRRERAGSGFPSPPDRVAVSAVRSPGLQQKVVPILAEAPVFRSAPGARSPANSISSRSVKSIPRSIRSGSLLAGPPSEAASDHPANTEILMESLIKLADPDFKVEPPSSVSSPAVSKSPSPSISARGGVFADIDKDLVLALLREVGQVCNGVLKAEKRQQGDIVKDLRNRMDVARQVLQGAADPDAEE